MVPHLNGSMEVSRCPLTYQITKFSRQHFCVYIEPILADTHPHAYFAASLPHTIKRWLQVSHGAHEQFV